MSILLGNDPDELVRNLQDRFPKARLVGADRAYEATVARVVGCIENPGIGLDLPLDVRGTAFQQRVWQALQDIPVGDTVSYADIARRIDAPKAVRAVAGACAANKLAVAIPVIGSCATTVLCRAMRGASSASARFWTARHCKTRKPRNRNAG